MEKGKSTSFPIRYKLIILFVCTSLFISAINVYMYINLKNTISKIDTVYNSNEFLNILLENLEQVQKSMFLYLDTKNSEILEEYYKQEEKFDFKVKELEHDITDNPVLLMEKNIYYMSMTYLEITEKVINAKRTRNIQKYRETYEESEVLYNEIASSIRHLNNMQFQNNSKKYEGLRNELNYLLFISAGILLIVIALNIFVIIVITKSMTKPLVLLAQAADRVAQGQFDVTVSEVNTRDEIGIVSRAFNKMIESIRLYILQVKENYERENEMKENELLMKNDLKDAQLKYLQAQINPHFLFNTLNAGVQLAMMEGAEKTSLFVENMADFFRYNVRKIDTDSTLEEELQLVDNYVYILNVRFAGDIHFYKQIDETALNVRVPSMIIQPIVENSINHGIKMMEGQGNIWLSVYQNNSEVCVSIKDNGIGIDKKIREKLLKGQAIESIQEQDATGIGMHNVINRMRRYYNTERVISIQSEGTDLGTEIILYIPRYQ